MSSQQPLEDLLGLPGHPVCNWTSTGQQVGKLSIRWHDHTAELTVVYAQVVVLVIPEEDQVSLVPIVESVANVTEQAFAELSFRHRFKSSVIKQLISTHACEVNPLCKFVFQFLNFLFKIDLIKESSTHFLFHAPISCETFLRGTFASSVFSTTKFYTMGNLCIWFLEVKFVNLLKLLSLGLIFLDEFRL